MADRGEDGDDVKTPLVRLESATSKSVKSSKADEGRGDDSWELGERKDDGGDLNVGLTIATQETVECRWWLACRTRLVGLAALPFQLRFPMFSRKDRVMEARLPLMLPQVGLY
jgi:hypothetical protein